MDSILGALRDGKAELARKRSANDLTADEMSVFGGRATKAAKEGLFASANELGGALVGRMQRPDATAGDKYREAYWKSVDLSKVAVERALLETRLKLAQSRSGAERAIQDASQTKEGAFAIYQLAPDVAKHPSAEVRLLSGRAQAALDSFLNAEPAYVAERAKQQAAFNECRAMASQLALAAQSEVGGGLPGPFGAESGTVGAIVAHFAVTEDGGLEYSQAGTVLATVRPPTAPATGARDGGVFDG
jgi:hypothetical protein